MMQRGLSTIQQQRQCLRVAMQTPAAAEQTQPPPPQEQRLVPPAVEQRLVPPPVEQRLVPPAVEQTQPPPARVEASTTSGRADAATTRAGGGTSCQSEFLCAPHPFLFSPLHCTLLLPLLNLSVEPPPRISSRGTIATALSLQHSHRRGY